MNKTLDGVSGVSMLANYKQVYMRLKIKNG